MNELNSFCTLLPSGQSLPDNVHYTPEGNRALGQQTARMIEASLGK